MVRNVCIDFSEKFETKVVSDARIVIKEKTTIFLEGERGGGLMKNIETNCLQGLKRQNKLLAKNICVKTLVCISKKQMFADAHKLKKKKQFAEEKFSYTHPSFQENNGPSPTSTENQRSLRDSTILHGVCVGEMLVLKAICDAVTH